MPTCPSGRIRGVHPLQIAKGKCPRVSVCPCPAQLIPLTVWVLFAFDLWALTRTMSSSSHHDQDVSSVAGPRVIPAQTERLEDSVLACADRMTTLVFMGPAQTRPGAQLKEKETGVLTFYFHSNTVPLLLTQPLLSPKCYMLVVNCWGAMEPGDRKEIGGPDLLL